MFAMQNDNPYMFTATLSGTSTSVPQRFAQIFDVWGLNIYAGMADTLNNYAQYVANGSDTQRPVIVSESGVPGGVNVPPGAAGPPDGTATARELTPDEFTNAINENMIPDAHAMQTRRNFVAGAQFFEWSTSGGRTARHPSQNKMRAPVLTGRRSGGGCMPSRRSAEPRRRAPGTTRPINPSHPTNSPPVQRSRRFRRYTPSSPAASPRLAPR